MKILVVTNLYPTPDNPSWGTFVEQQVQGLRRIGLEVDLFIVDRVGKGVKAYFGLQKKLRVHLTVSNPEVVHVMYGGVLAELVTRVVRDRPVIVSFCGTDLLGGSYFRHFRWLAVQYDLFASHLAAKRADAIIVKSPNLEAALPQTIDLNKVRIIPNGVDLQKFQPQDPGESRRQLGWQENRYHILTTAFPGHARKRFPLAEATLAKLKQEGMAVELHQLHAVPHADVPLWLNGSDVLLLTSIHEGSPNIVKEALACNRSVVSTDVGDVRERIQDLEGCYIALPDPDDLAMKIRLVLNGNWSVDGRVGLESLSLERVAQRLSRIYSNVLDKNWQYPTSARVGRDTA